jgi:hypothetical protein
MVPSPAVAALDRADVAPVAKSAEAGDMVIACTRQQKRKTRPPGARRTGLTAAGLPLKPLEPPIDHA